MRNMFEIPKQLESLVDRYYVKYYADPKPMMVKWLDIKSHCLKYSPYEDIVRKLQEVFNVAVLYNPRSIHEGLHIVGKTHLVIGYTRALLSIIKVIEYRVKNYRQEDPDTHKNRLNSTYQYELCRKALYFSMDALDYSLKLRSPKTTSDFIVDTMLTIELIKSTPILKRKTKYHESVRYID